MPDTAREAGTNTWVMFSDGPLQMDMPVGKQELNLQPYLPTPLFRQDMTQGQFLSGV